MKPSHCSSSSSSQKVSVPFTFVSTCPALVADWDCLTIDLLSSLLLSYTDEKRQEQEEREQEQEQEHLTSSNETPSHNPRGLGGVWKWEQKPRQNEPLEDFVPQTFDPEIHLPPLPPSATGKETSRKEPLGDFISDTYDLEISLPPSHSSATGKATEAPLSNGNIDDEVIRLEHTLTTLSGPSSEYRLSITLTLTPLPIPCPPSHHQAAPMENPIPDHIPNKYLEIPASLARALDTPREYDESAAAGGSMEEKKRDLGEEELMRLLGLLRSTNEALFEETGERGFGEVLMSGVLPFENEEGEAVEGGWEWEAKWRYWGVVFTADGVEEVRTCGEMPISSLEVFGGELFVDEDADDVVVVKGMDMDMEMPETGAERELRDLVREILVEETLEEALGREIPEKVEEMEVEREDL